MKRLLFIFIALLSFMGCTKNEGFSLNTTEVYMYSLDSHIITSNGTNVSFSSRNPYVASVNETTGQVTANHIGKTIIDVVSDQGTSSVSVTVKPKYNTIIDPEIEWLVDQFVIEYRCGDPYIQDDKSMTYVYGKVADDDKHISTTYRFTDDMLDAVIVTLNNKYWSEAALHLAERYQFIGEDDNMYVYIDDLDYERAQTLISLSKQGGQWVILYTERK